MNEAQTESELLIKYYQSLFNGELQCIERINSRKESELSNKIVELRSQLEMEKQVSEKIQQYIIKRRKEVDNDVEHREKLKEKKQSDLVAEKEEILEKKEEAYKES